MDDLMKKPIETKSSPAIEGLAVVVVLMSLIAFTWGVWVVAGDMANAAIVGVAQMGSINDYMPR